MAEVTRSREIAASADDVWATVGDFAAVGRYSPLVAKLELEGERGPGQIRRLTLTNDSITVSRCTALDDEARSVSYQILVTALPLTDYTSTQTVRSVDDGRCEVVWTSRFEPKGAQAAGFLEKQLEDGLAELASQLE